MGCFVVAILLLTSDSDCASVCEDDPAFDCAHVSTAFDICADVSHAKTVCAKFCNYCQPAPYWLEWGEWKCVHYNDQCFMSRVRNCSTWDSSECTGANSDIKVCDNIHCLNAPHWMSWSSYQCKYSHGNCFQARYRNCSTDKYPGCHGGLGSEVQICSNTVCPGPTWSEWGSYQCEYRRGQCFMKRFRKCSTGLSTDCDTGHSFELHFCNNTICTDTNYTTSTVQTMEQSTTKHVASTTIAPVASTTIAPAASTTIVPVASTTIAPVVSTTIAPVASTTIAPVTSTTIAPVTSTTTVPVALTTSARTKPILTATTSTTTTSPVTDGKPSIHLTPPGPEIKHIYFTSSFVVCSSDPGVTIYWTFKNTVGLPEGASMDSGGNLIIQHVNETNAGLYTCVAVSKSGLTSMASLFINIKPTPAIVLEVVKHTKTVGSHTNITLECKIIGYPTPVVTWAFTDPNGKTVVPTGVIFLNNNKGLLIENYSSFYDDGIWVCSASNNLGHSSGATSIP